MLSYEEMQRLEMEMPNAVKVNSLFITPTAICMYGFRTFSVIPVRDILWIYGTITKETMNFIPTGKIFTLRTVTRNGHNQFILTLNKGPFAKNTLIEEKLALIRNVLYPYRCGIVYGWSDELNMLFTRDLARGIQMVDGNSVNPNQGY